MVFESSSRFFISLLNSFCVSLRGRNSQEHGVQGQGYAPSEGRGSTKGSSTFKRRVLCLTSVWGSGSDFYEPVVESAMPADCV